MNGKSAMQGAGRIARKYRIALVLRMSPAMVFDPGLGVRWVGL